MGSDQDGTNPEAEHQGEHHDLQGEAPDHPRWGTIGLRAKVRMNVSR